ncbi:hypothetical protein AX17_001641 [Amanita inopinata Kibby_2008]|nr:hypothetical protein AX17_001641 [Amanita inopinata Kibby_2008]
MGLLKEGPVLTWEETQERAGLIKRLGIEQFLKIWDKEAKRRDEVHTWGDEIEYMLVHFDEANKNATLATCQDEVLDRLNSNISNLSPASRLIQPSFSTEFAKYQIETAPGTPYTAALQELLQVEGSMRQRREMIRQQLRQKEAPITLSTFPRLGAPGIFSYPPDFGVRKWIGGESDGAREIDCFPLSLRRGFQSFAYVPVFFDKFTERPFYDPIHFRRAKGPGAELPPIRENKPEYNDVTIPFDEGAYDKLRQHGIDDRLSKYIAYLFTREPLIAYSNDFYDDDIQKVNHFENINSSVWQAMRLKPPQNAAMGWRVEFRNIEASITDFEGAAYAIFIVLISCAILHYDLNLYIPISKVVDNMHVAQRRNAAVRETFAFRKAIDTHKRCHHEEKHTCSSPIATSEYEDMSLDEIFNGSDAKCFPGLLTFVEKYIESQNPDEETRAVLQDYVDFIRGKAKGTYITTAAWIRNFVRSHPKYLSDSIISEEVGFDLMVAVDKISRGELRALTLLPR